jgi:hypothetical protein
MLRIFSIPLQIERVIMHNVNSYDIDGVILLDDTYQGVTPTEKDVIITGRSEEEKEYTLEALHERDIWNKVYFNPLPFNKKTRESSGVHKANVLTELYKGGVYNIRLHFEDDPIQAAIIELRCPWIKVILLQHNLVNKENIWRGE